MPQARRIIALAGLLILLASLVILLLSVLPSARTTTITPLAPDDLLPPTEAAYHGDSNERYVLAPPRDEFQ